MGATAHLPAHSGTPLRRTLTGTSEPRLELGHEVFIEVVGDAIGSGIISKGDHGIRDGDDAKAHADGGSDADATGKQGQAIAYRKAKRHDGRLESLNRHTNGEGRRVEYRNGVLGDTIEEFGHNVGPKACNRRDTDTTLGKGANDGAQKLACLTGVELEKRGVGSGKTALNVQRIDMLGKQFMQSLSDRAAIDTADEAIRIVIGDAVFLQTLGEHFRGEGETSQEEGIKFKNNG